MRYKKNPLQNQVIHGLKTWLRDFPGILTPSSASAFFQGLVALTFLHVQLDLDQVTNLTSLNDYQLLALRNIFLASVACLRLLPYIINKDK